MTDISARPFGSGPTGEKIDLFTLRNGETEIAITNFGGRLVSVTVPGRDGDPKDVVLGFDSLEGYLNKNPYFGATVGRYANRIANARFELDGQVFHLDRNSGENSLHGGAHGFDKVIWEPEVVTEASGPCLRLKHLSPDGDEGYPGNLTAYVTFSLGDSGEVQIEFRAATDRKTVLNLTNHSYFDLSGDQGRNNILNHEATIYADRFVPANEHLIPTGELLPVEGTPFDFRACHRIGERIDSKNEQLKLAIGYDHTFVLNGQPGELRLAARVRDPASGRVLEVLTTEPGVQFYTGNHLNGSVTGKDGVVYGFRSAFCLETQHFPDSPNQPQFPSTELNPGQEYRSRTIFRFSVDS